MDEEVIRQHATAMCDALVAGDIDRATADFSKELKQHLGEVLSLLPLPATEGTVQSVNHAGSGFDVVLRLVSWFHVAQSMGSQGGSFTPLKPRSRGFAGSTS